MGSPEAPYRRVNIAPVEGFTCSAVGGGLTAHTALYTCFSFILNPSYAPRLYQCARQHGASSAAPVSVGMLLSLASAAQPPQCSGQRLLASWPCSANLTIHCGPEGNEQCVASIADCSALLSCAPPNHVRCADGTCTSSAGNCIAAAAPCGVGVLCADGSCGSTAAACTAVPGCPTSAPTRCADGSCATVSSGCATLYPCAPAMERCADGQCALRHRCPPTDGCTLTLPQRCADGRCYAAGGHLKPYELGLGLRLGSGVAATPRRVSGRSGVPTAACFAARGCTNPNPNPNPDPNPNPNPKQEPTAP